MPVTAFIGSAHLTSSFCYRLVFSEQIRRVQNGKLWEIPLGKMSLNKLVFESRLPWPGLEVRGSGCSGSSENQGQRISGFLIVTKTHLNLSCS